MSDNKEMNRNDHDNPRNTKFLSLSVLDKNSFEKRIILRSYLLVRKPDNLKTLKKHSCRIVSQESHNSKRSEVYPYLKGFRILSTYFENGNIGRFELDLSHTKVLEAKKQLLEMDRACLALMPNNHNEFDARLKEFFGKEAIDKCILSLTQIRGHEHHGEDQNDQTEFTGPEADRESGNEKSVLPKSVFCSFRNDFGSKAKKKLDEKETIRN